MRESDDCRIEKFEKSSLQGCCTGKYSIIHKVFSSPNPTTNFETKNPNVHEIFNQFEYV